MALQLVCLTPRRLLLGHVSRARLKDVVSSGQRAASSLPLHVATHPQNRHVPTSAGQRI